jgi:apolipoprotein N-acyltransferase
MTQALLPSIWLVLGASFLALTTRMAIPPLAWAGLLFLLHASRSVTAGAGVAWFWVALYVSVLVGFRPSLPATGAIYFAISAFFATTIAVPFLVDRLVMQRAGAMLAVLAFPIAFVTVEFLRSRLTATWGSIAYTQYGVLPLMQVAAFAGIWAITFLIAWFASAFDLAWRYGFAWSTGGRPLSVFAVVTAIVILAGTIRVALAPTNGRSMRVAAINRPLDLFVPGEMTRISEGRVSPAERPAFAQKLHRLHDWFLEGSRREARAGARLVVWPEQNLLVFKDDEPAFLVRATRLAADEHVYLAMGMGTIYLGERLPFENKLVLVDPTGRIAMSYVKEHPVMGWEAGIMRVGSGGIHVLPTADGRVAGAICFDADFPSYIRRAGLGATELFVLPVNEWRSIKDIHLQMHVFRAIENGMPIVRAAAVGLSAAVDPWGRVLGVADHFAPGDSTLVAQVPIGHVPTLYARVGDLFAWLCVAGLVSMLGIGAVAAANRLAGVRPAAPALTGISTEGPTR